VLLPDPAHIRDRECCEDSSSRLSNGTAICMHSISFNQNFTAFWMGRKNIFGPGTATQGTFATRAGGTG